MDKIVHLSDSEESEWISFEKSNTIEMGVPLFPDPFQITLQIEAAVRIPLEYNYEENETKLRWRNDWRENSTISIRTEPIGSSERLLLFIFLKSLNSLPLKSIRRCEECGRWFIHVTKREKMYCGNLCAARKSNRDRRIKTKSKDPTAYEQELKKSRKRARKSYEEKVKRDNPKAKIQHRPLKTK